MLGLEHAASLTFEALGPSADPAVFFHVLSRGPARVAQLRREDGRVRHSAHGGAMGVGEDANVTVFDPAAQWIVDRTTMASRSMNTPYDGRAMVGRVRATIAKGRLVVDEGTSHVMRPPSVLVLADGTTFEGYAAGHLPEDGFTSGEFVFNTALSGYQEVITDPSYAGQIISFTYPHIGNYGVTPLDDESLRSVVRRRRDARTVRPPVQLAFGRPARGLPAPTPRRRPSSGVDTRRLTRHLRAHGALPGAFGHGDPATVARRGARGARHRRHRLGRAGVDRR